MQQTIMIEGMGCDHCVEAVRAALANLDGVIVEDVEIGRARVDVDPGIATADEIDAAIRQAGYETSSRAEM